MCVSVESEMGAESRERSSDMSTFVYAEPEKMEMEPLILPLLLLPKDFFSWQALKWNK